VTAARARLGTLLVVITGVAAAVALAATAPTGDGDGVDASEALTTEPVDRLGVADLASQAASPSVSDTPFGGLVVPESTVSPSADATKPLEASDAAAGEPGAANEDSGARPTTSAGGSVPTSPQANAPTTTGSPVTDRPNDPTTSAPTASPTSPSTSAPTTEAPTTRPPTTRPPTTQAPTTRPPTTQEPTTQEPTTMPPPASGRVVWQDTFDRFDSAVWTREHSTYGDGNNELQCYRPDNVSVADSKLILRARHETYTCPNGSTRRVTSGMVRSRGVNFGPGQAIEFRVKLNPADPDDQGGLWPAVWSSGWAGGWPQGGELDYLEVMTAENPRRAMFSMHYANSSNGHALQNRGEVLDRYFSDDWHEVRFEYGRNGTLVWFLDGRETFRVVDADTLQGYPAPFNQATGEIKINLALGGRPGPLSWAALGTTGATFEVDWIRIVEL
jgi:hypothetical protein